MKCPGCGEEKKIKDEDNSLPFLCGPAELEDSLVYLKKFECEVCGTYWWMRRDYHYCWHCRRYLPFPASLCSSCDYGGVYDA